MNTAKPASMYVPGRLYQVVIKIQVDVFSPLTAVALSRREEGGLRVTHLFKTSMAYMAYKVIVELGIIGQFRALESPGVNSGINSWGLRSCAQIDLRKARDRELATLDEKSTSSGIAELYAR